MAHAANAEKILRRNLDKIAQEQNYTDPDFKVVPVSTEGANFSSFLFRATVSGKGKPDLNLFAKVSAVSENIREHMPMKVFETEELFYTDLVKQYRELEDKHGVPEEHRFRCPKMYRVDTTLYEETFVIEDLTATGYKLYDRFESVDWEFAAAAFAEIAKMHALSFALQHEKPEKFKKFTDFFQFNKNFLDDQEGNMMKVLIESNMQKTLAVTEEKYREKVMTFFGNLMGERGVEMFMKFYLPGEKPVIRHGDYRASNVMYTRQEDGSVNIAVLDFQTLLAGSPIIDLLYFLFLGTDKQFRDQYYQQLIEHYYEELKKALRRFQLDPEEVYSRKTFDEDYRENVPYGLVVSVTMLGLVTVEAGAAPAVSGHADMASFLEMPTSALYRRRINEIFEDFTLWGIL